MSPVTRLFAGCAAAFILASVPPAAAQLNGETPYEFTARSGETVAAFRGAFLVPENRSDPDSRMIELGYVRFPATSERAGSPIVYLAGGPGGSGVLTATGRRFPLFMAMREHGDVIAFDQRGTNWSDDTPRCTSDEILEDDIAYSDAEIAAVYRRAVEACGAFWREQGVDVRGYTTAESARDLSALRRHLGAERLSLWGISYGSHLALAAIDILPDELDRVIITGAEGLDQTVKLPARTDAYFARMQAAIDAQPDAAAILPDIDGLMRRVHARLEAEPVMLAIPTPDGGATPLLVTRQRAQFFASFGIADPANARYLFLIYYLLDAGEHEALAALLANFHDPAAPIDLRVMPTAMDLASGITAERLARVEAQARNSLVGGYLNFPMPQIRGALDGLDLGDDFRNGPSGDVPVLLLTGTLDGRTYIEGQREAVAGLTNVTQIMVENAGHNLFMSSPEVGEAMARFMRGEAAASDVITVDPPDFAAVFRR